MRNQKINRRDFVKMSSAAAVGLSALSFVGCNSASAYKIIDAPTGEPTDTVPTPRFSNYDPKIMQQVEELLQKMTLEEKAMQLSCVVPLALLDSTGLMDNQADKLIKQGIGHVAGIGLLGRKSPETIANSVNAIQRYLVTKTRLKIPAIFHNEALNGVVAPNFSAFPTPIGLAATWDTVAVQGWQPSCGARCVQQACSMHSHQ